MKYIITESQYNLIQEIERVSGHFEFSPLDSFFEYMNDKIPTKQKVKLFIDFFENKIGRKIEYEDGFLRSDVEDYFNHPLRSDWNHHFTSKDSRSGFAYYVAKKYFGLQDKFGLSYMINKLGNSERIYYFFDPSLKIFVGRFMIQKKSYFLKKAWKVNLSTADEELVGSGYGTRMYLVIIDDVEYLASDDTLYSGSYRIWKHVLPKYVNVWGVIKDEDGIISKFVKLNDKNKNMVRKFDYFVASSKHNKI